jgi:hypothetical protein
LKFRRQFKMETASLSNPLILKRGWKNGLTR